MLGRHVLPNAAGPVIVPATLGFGASILAVSALSFLGYGAPPPTPECGTLISGGRNYLANAWWLTALPGLAGHNELYAVDRSTVPPNADRSPRYTVLVPAVDSDGNETAGIRAPMVAVPLATCTGWNTRARGQGHGALHEFSGSTFPFDYTAAIGLVVPAPSLRAT